MMIPSTNTELVRQLINSYGFSVNELAREIDVTPPTIYRILKNNNKKGSYKTNFSLLSFYLCVTQNFK